MIIEIKDNRVRVTFRDPEIAGFSKYKIVNGKLVEEDNWDTLIMNSDKCWAEYYTEEFLERCSNVYSSYTKPLLNAIKKIGSGEVDKW